MRQRRHHLDCLARGDVVCDVGWQCVAFCLVDGHVVSGRWAVGCRRRVEPERRRAIWRQRMGTVGFEWQLDKRAVDELVEQRRLSGIHMER